MPQDSLLAAVQKWFNYSHDLISSIRFLVTKIECRRSDSPISKFRFCRPFSYFKKSVG